MMMSTRWNGALSLTDQQKHGGTARVEQEEQEGVQRLLALRRTLTVLVLRTRIHSRKKALSELVHKLGLFFSRLVLAHHSSKEIHEQLLELFHILGLSISTSQR